MKRKHLLYRVRAASTALFLGAFLAVIAGAITHAAEPVRIGLTLGLTGKYAKLGAMQQRAYLLWQRDVNEKGGLLGRPVKVLIEDDESTPDKSVELYRSFISEDRVDLLFGPYSSGITAAIAPIADKADYPLVAGGASSDKIWQQGYRNIFGVYTPASRYTVGILNLALINDLATVAIVYADDAFSISAGEGARKWAPKLGLNIVMFEKFKKGRRDLSDLAEKAKLANPSLLIVAGHFDESVDMRLALKKVGWYPKAYFATVGPVLARYPTALGQDSELTFASSLWEPNLKFPRSREFASRFRALYRIEPTYHAATAYAAGQILEEAVKAVGSLTRDKVRQTLQNLQTYTVVGRYQVDPTGIQVKHFPLTIQWQEGKKEIVWPEEVRTAQPIFK
jgi:branched-chain amino acid transport system substrate-binding protein